MSELTRRQIQNIRDSAYQVPLTNGTQNALCDMALRTHDAEQRADQAEELRDTLAGLLLDTRQEAARLREALQQIEKCEGAYSRDPLTHAENVLKEHERIAQEALQSAPPASEPDGTIVTGDDPAPAKCPSCDGAGLQTHSTTGEPRECPDCGGDTTTPADSPAIGTWPEGVSDGLTLPCSYCGQVPWFDYRVDDNAWRTLVPTEYRTSVVCLPCLDRLAWSQGIRIAERIEKIEFTGTGCTARCEPTLTARHHNPTPADHAEEGEKCDACGHRYQSIYRVPDDVWHQIRPKDSEFGGLLCMECAWKRAKEAGITLYFEAYAGWWPEDRPESSEALTVWCIEKAHRYENGRLMETYVHDPFSSEWDFRAIPESEVHQSLSQPAPAVPGNPQNLQPEIDDLKRVIRELAGYKGRHAEAYIDGGRSLETIERALAAQPSESPAVPEVNDDMAMAFHYAITDASIGKDDVEEIKIGLRAALAHLTDSAAPTPTDDGEDDG